MGTARLNQLSSCKDGLPSSLHSRAWLYRLITLDRVSSTVLSYTSLTSHSPSEAGRSYSELILTSIPHSVTPSNPPRMHLDLPCLTTTYTLSSPLDLIHYPLVPIYTRSILGHMYVSSRDITTVTSQTRLGT